MQTSNDLENDSIHIWRVDLDGPVNDLAGLLSDDEISRAEAKLQIKEQERFIRARGAMRSILGDYLGVPGSELEFIQGEKGKPDIKQPESNIEFNLSHCEDLALLAIAKQIPLGIDLERVHSRPSQLKIAQRMFSEQIYSELKQLPSDQLDREFFHYWTEMEARAKCVGDGIFSRENGVNAITTRHFSPLEGWIACIAANGTDLSKMELKHFLYRN